MCVCVCVCLCACVRARACVRVYCCMVRTGGSTAGQLLPEMRVPFAWFLMGFFFLHRKAIIVGAV